MSTIRFFFAIILVSIVLMIIPATAANLNFSSPGTANASSDAHYFITIDPIGNHTVGDVFFINGTTNLLVSENNTLYLSITPRNFNPRGLAYYKNLELIPGQNGVYRWSENVTDLDWNARDDYFIQVSSINPLVSGVQDFKIREGNISFIPSPSLTQPSSQITTIGQPSFSHATIPSGQVAPSSMILSIFAIMVGIVFTTHFAGKRGGES